MKINKIAIFVLHVYCQQRSKWFFTVVNNPIQLHLPQTAYIYIYLFFAADCAPPQYTLFGHLCDQIMRIVFFVIGLANNEHLNELSITISTTFPWLLTILLLRLLGLD